MVLTSPTVRTISQNIAVTVRMPGPGRVSPAAPCLPIRAHPPARGDQHQEKRPEQLGEDAPPLVLAVPEVEPAGKGVRLAHGAQRDRGTPGDLLRLGRARGGRPGLAAAQRQASRIPGTRPGSGRLTRPESDG